MNPRIIKLLIKGFKEKNELELQIENQIATEDMRDVIELIKEIQDQADRKID